MFCAIVAGDEDADVVLDVDAAIGFLDRSPLFKGHVLIVPRVHVVTLPELDPSALSSKRCNSCPPPSRRHSVRRGRSWR